MAPAASDPRDPSSLRSEDLAHSPGVPDRCAAVRRALAERGDASENCDPPSLPLGPGDEARSPCVLRPHWGGDSERGEKWHYRTRTRFSSCWSPSE